MLNNCRLCFNIKCIIVDYFYILYAFPNFFLFLIKIARIWTRTIERKATANSAAEHPFRPIATRATFSPLPDAVLLVDSPPAARPLARWRGERSVGTVRRGSADRRQLSRRRDPAFVIDHSQRDENPTFLVSLPASIRPISLFAPVSPIAGTRRAGGEIWNPSERKTMDDQSQVFRIHNPDDFNLITKGIKVARCMQSRSSYGKLRRFEVASAIHSRCIHDEFIYVS